MRTGSYCLVFAALLALLGLTLAGHALHWGAAAALCIAGAKATLVGVWFMHLNVATSTVRAAACTGIVFLSILLALTVNDYANRERSIENARLRRGE